MSSLAPIDHLSDDEATGCMVRLPPLTALSDEEPLGDGGTSSAQPLGDKRGCKRSRGDWRPDPNLRSVLAKILQSRCKCSQALLKRKAGRSCFHQFPSSAVNQLIEIRSNLGRMHKNDSDRKVLCMKMQKL